MNAKYKLCSLRLKDLARVPLDDIGTDRVYEEFVIAEFDTLEAALHHCGMAEFDPCLHINFDDRWDLRPTPRMS